MRTKLSVAKELSCSKVYLPDWKIHNLLHKVMNNFIQSLYNVELLVNKGYSSANHMAAAQYFERCGWDEVQCEHQNEDERGSEGTLKVFVSCCGLQV